MIPSVSPALLQKGGARNEHAGIPGRRSKRPPQPGRFMGEDAVGILPPYSETKNRIFYFLSQSKITTPRGSSIIRLPILAPVMQSTPVSGTSMLRASRFMLIINR